MLAWEQLNIKEFGSELDIEGGGVLAWLSNGSRDTSKPTCYLDCPWSVSERPNLQCSATAYDSITDPETHHWHNF